MKIKVQPEDFVVEEFIDLPFAKKGPYTILRLRKRYWNTLDVIDCIARKLNVSKRLFSRAGLKDRYSLSTQYLSFHGTLSREIREKNFAVSPVGMAYRPLSPFHMTGNKFTITLRSLDAKEIETLTANYGDVVRSGLPNFFDEQRFGSARHRQGFFARELLHRHYRGAIKLLLCYPYREDGIREKKFKHCCAQHWDKIQRCQHLAPPNYRKIMNILATRPKNFRTVLKAIDRELLNLYLLAYQSYLFNETANAIIECHAMAPATIPYSVGRFVFYRKLHESATLEKISIPMVHEKLSLRGKVGTIIESLLQREGLCLKDFALGHMRFRGVRFKPFQRPLILRPRDFTLGTPEEDERYKGKMKMQLCFFLPPGSYATLLIKRLACQG